MEKNKNQKALTETDLCLPVHTRGKVRDIYELDDNLLIIATDRISTYDVVHPNGIPNKGKILTQLSLFWINFLRKNTKIQDHLISSSVDDLPKEIKLGYKDTLEGRIMMVKKAIPVPIECVVRGYLYGSAWEDYKRTGNICGIKLPKKLQMVEKLSEPIFTPSTKATIGHDENIPFEKAEDLVGKEVMRRIRDYSLEIYKKAHDYAEKKGIIIADTKFEFGITNGEIILIDEILTPDSSRFWNTKKYKRGQKPESFDKQFVRDYVTSIGWDKKPPAPELPLGIIKKTKEKYQEAYQRLTGNEWK